MNEKVQIIDDDEIITLFDEDDKPMNFYEVAVVEYNDELYALLQPAEEIEGIADDEVVIFKIDDSESESDDYFYPVEDEETQDAVFQEYLRATTSEESAEEVYGEGCDENCEDCPGAAECLNRENND